MDCRVKPGNDVERVVVIDLRSGAFPRLLDCNFKIVYGAPKGEAFLERYAMPADFFWGIVVGLVLSFFGAWLLAKFTISQMQRHQRRTMSRFCIDTVQNVQSIIDEMDTTRSRAQAIHHDFLNLLEVELAIYGRVREHLIILPDAERAKMRKFMNDVALKRADILKHLDRFYKTSNMADQIRAAGRPPEADRLLQTQGQPQLDEAQKAADKLVVIGKDGNQIIAEMTKIAGTARHWQRG